MTTPTTNPSPSVAVRRATESKLPCDLCRRETPLSLLAGHEVLFEEKGEQPSGYYLDLCARCVKEASSGTMSDPFWAMPCEACGIRRCGAQDIYLTHLGSTSGGGDDPSEYEYRCGDCAPSDPNDFYDSYEEEGP